MEYQGIITGIGDKELGKNLIKPEYDAIINDFIIGKNTILEGLVLNGKNISAGTCILCGYRGIIDTPKDLQNATYVYGEFTLNSIYGGSGEDSFDVIGVSAPKTENVNPTEITSAGTYYLLLYANGVLSKDLDTEHPYPFNAQYSVETEKVLDGAKIESEVEGVTHLPNDNSNRIATTQYVHNQIEEEIDYDMCNGTLYDTRGGIVFTYNLYRKSKYVIGKLTFPRENQSSVFTSGDIQLPNGFKPLENVIFMGIASEYYYWAAYSIDSSGNFNNVINTAERVSDFDGVTSTISIGYRCK